MTTISTELYVAMQRVIETAQNVSINSSDISDGLPDDYCELRDALASLGAIELTELEAGK